MQLKKSINVFWFRRDLRLEDNIGLFHALKSNLPVLPLFIFDTEILSHLTDKKDKRVNLIYKRLVQLNNQLRAYECSFCIKIGSPAAVFEQLCSEFNIEAVFCNKDYEPNAIVRDNRVAALLSNQGKSFFSFKDQVIFEQNDILKPNKQPYTVYTPYSKNWKNTLTASDYEACESETLLFNLIKHSNFTIPSLEQIGFETVSVSWPEYNIANQLLINYRKSRNTPALDTGTSALSVHLRFGTVSIRKIVAIALKNSDEFLNELIWREFFMSILFHFPYVENNPFKQQYRNINWLNNESDFEKWCLGKTGYPIVDAGMRALNSTGLMHNRIRMITASFLVKHLLIDWQWGEAYFAQKLLDFDLAANNGNWQWVAGTGCDAAPYFRIFNPAEQTKKFDSNLIYIRKWIPELDTPEYPLPIINHPLARNRALNTYKEAINGIFLV